MNLLALREKYFIDSKFQSKYDFIEIYKYPFLVKFSIPYSLSNSEEKDYLKTITAENLDELLNSSNEIKQPKNLKVIIPVVKTSKNPFTDKITIGRTSAQDILIEDLTISKSHSYFQVINEKYYLTDNDSKNGTFVNGKRLNQESYLLKDKDVVSFSSHSFVFYENETLYDVLNEFNKDDF